MTTIICLANIEWDFTWQRHQEVMFRFAERGHKIIFVENIGSRSISHRDLPRLVRLVKNRVLNRGTIKNKRHRNVELLRPVVIPFHSSGIIAKMNALLIRKQLEKRLSTDEYSNAIFWVYLPNPTYLELLLMVRPENVIYDCVSDFKSLENGEVLRRCEQAIVRMSKAVITDSQKLFHDKKLLTTNLQRIPTGINMPRSGSGLPAELVDFTGPIIGYIGSISRWVDIDLIRRAALSHRDKRFVLVGPVNTDVRGLRDVENVYFVGQKDKAEVSRYLSAFDICIIPYKKCDFTDYVYPVKLVEYLTTNKPIVSTDLYEVSTFGDVVSVARNSEEFISLLGVDVTHNINPQKRENFVKENTWESRFLEFTRVIDTLNPVRES